LTKDKNWIRLIENCLAFF